MWAYLLFILGFVVLIKGSSWLLNGSTIVAKRLNLSGVLVGLTLIAFGTSLPELVITLFSNFRGESELLVGGVIGSNIANILLILGTAGIIYPIAVKQETVWKEIPLSLLAVLALSIVTADTFLDQAEINIISRTDALVLLLFLSVFLYYLFSIRKSKTWPKEPEEGSDLAGAGWRLVAGIVSLYLGGRWIVDNALFIAESWGVSHTLVGAGLIALGTSLPELSTSVLAASKKQPDIVIGNVIGSNIFNVFLILGLNSSLIPIPVTADLGFDIAVMIFAHILLFMFLFLGQRHTLQRSQAYIFLAVYISYILFLMVRG